MKSGALVLISFLVVSSLSLYGCSSGFNGTQLIPAAPIDNGAFSGDFVSKSKFIAVISSENKLVSLTPFAALANPATIPVSVINVADAKMEVDTTGFAIPPVSNAVLDFGSLKISDLKDNNLKACGVDGKTKCGTAVIRVYTTGTAGDGLYNSVDGYGMPITAGLAGTTALSVGLNAANAAVVHSVTIPATKNVFNLSDLSPTPVYQIKSDFTNAGAGTYSTTLIVEYGLTL